MKIENYVRGKAIRALPPSWVGPQDVLTPERRAEGIKLSGALADPKRAAKNPMCASYAKKRHHW